MQANNQTDPEPGKMLFAVFLKLHPGIFTVYHGDLQMPWEGGMVGFGNHCQSHLSLSSSHCFSMVISRSLFFSTVKKILIVGAFELTPLS